MRRAFFVACTAEVVIARRTATKRFRELLHKFLIPLSIRFL
jgi:hypothetical protein